MSNHLWIILGGLNMYLLFTSFHLWLSVTDYSNITKTPTNEALGYRYFLIYTPTSTFGSTFDKISLLVM